MLAIKNQWENSKNSTKEHHHQENHHQMNIENLRKYIKTFQFNKMFVESLGWEHPQDSTSNIIPINGRAVSYSKIAEINKVPVLKFNSKHLKEYENNLKFYKTIKKQYHQYITLFSDDKNFFSLSYLSKKNQVSTCSYFKGQSGDYFINKLVGIHFGIEEGDPKISDIRHRLENTFDTKEVTKKFFEHFKSNHINFMQYISGIKTEEEKKWFASLILNRLMFIWFLQKKGFINKDFDYLKTKLKQSQQRGKDRYYREFLTLLFFEGFAKKPIERSDKAQKLLGKIKYLNGGLFVPHPIEEKYQNKIKIQDKAFDETFTMFSKYDWHLQGKQGTSDSEISPDVLGYIFEKYINELQQKTLGAYYTRDEITSYLSRNTIQKCVLDKVNNKGYNFKTIEDMLHNLDATLCKLLLTNENSILNTLTVLDPAMGSGAFLVSAMKELINIYSPIIGKIETLNNQDLNKWMSDFKNQHKSIDYGVKKNIILKNLYGVDIMKEATEVCKLRLFLDLVSVALTTEELEPLPNMDFNIMCGNSLIGLLNETNIEKQFLLLKTENNLSYSEIKNKYNNLVSQYKNKPLSFNKLKELKNKTNSFLAKHSKSLNQLLADKCTQANLKYTPIIDIKGKKKVLGKKREVYATDFYSEDNSKGLNPFHWDFAFNEIINKGGFDVIITNPPWEKIKSEDREFFHKYDKSIDKKKTPKPVLKRKKQELLKNPKIEKDYLKTEEHYLFQRNYFSKIYQYQSGEIKNVDGTKRQASSDMESYRLFTERYLDLLNKKGVLGAVLPSGLHKDDGSIALRRKLLFNKVKIEGLVDFQNQMGRGKGRIFEGVHPSFKFLLLNLKKDKPKDLFPCQFMTRELQVLENFPEKNTMTQSIKQIQELSPRDLSIIEFKNPQDISLFKKQNTFSELREQKNSWNPIFYREFDETNDSHLFKSTKTSKSDLPLFKGSDIYQYESNYNKKPAIKRYIDKMSSKVQQGKGVPFKNKCYTKYRLVIRTIARNTDERSLISAIIPKNHFIANTLYGVHIKTENNLSKPKNINKYMLLLQSFLNSFVVDYFLRLKISASINLKYLMPLCIPRLTENKPWFKELILRSAKLTCTGKEFDELANEVGITRGGVTDPQARYKLQGEIDAIVARIYGLTSSEFTYILSTFKTGKNQTRLQALKNYAMEAFEKNNSSKKAS